MCLFYINGHGTAAATVVSKSYDINQTVTYEVEQLSKCIHTKSIQARTDTCYCSVDKIRYMTPNNNNNNNVP